VSSVFDVDTISIDESDAIDFSSKVESVEILVDSDIETVTITQPDDVRSVMVEVPGIQGEPGVKNVYVQSENPATQFGWGAAEKGYIWIEVEV